MTRTVGAAGAAPASSSDWHGPQLGILSWGSRYCSRLLDAPELGPLLDPPAPGAEGRDAEDEQQYPANGRRRRRRHAAVRNFNPAVEAAALLPRH